MTDVHEIHVSGAAAAPETADAPNDGDLRRLLEESRREVEELGKKLALRERERDLQKQYDVYRERKRREQEEAQSLRKLYTDLLFETNPNTLFLFDEKLRYVLGSHRFLIKALPEDLEGKKLVDVFSGVDETWIEKVRRQCESVIDGQQLWRYSDRLHFQDGVLVDVQVIISPVTQENGRKRGVLIAINDVTELANARQRAEEADRMKSDFLAHVSHEIRTPMNAIVGITEILLHDRELTMSQRKYISDVKVSSNSLLTIINDILDFSKLDSGRMALTPINFDLRLLVDNLCSLIAYTASEKNIGFTFDVDGNLPQCLYGDDVRLRQVLLNLLSNAVKFTNEGQVSLKVTAGQDTITFAVADTGLGIKAEDLPALFEPFSQFDKKKSRNLQGTGLGLSICRSLVDLMGGEIKVESSYGQGSEFRVILPKTEGDPSLLSTHGVGANDLYTDETKLLVVDDNEINLSVASGLLRTLHGIVCETALSGEEAVEKTRAKDYHLIFMDHMMPGMDGVETAAHIRLLGGENATVPIVALTANAVSGAREMLLASAMNDFLAKPIDKHELGSVLRRWLPAGLRRESDGADRSDLGETTIFSPVLTKVMEIREIDFSAGLETLGGNGEAYEQSLRLLCRKIPEVNAGMEESLIGQGDLRAFGIQVHGMKSSLASVGAMGLGRVAANLEKLSQGGDEGGCKADFPAFSENLLALGRSLADAFGGALESGSGERVAGDDEKFGDVLGELRCALGTYDYDAVMEGLNRAMGFDFGEERNGVFVDVKDRVDEFNYPGALDLLDGLK